MGSDQENRFMIGVFRPVIRICLIPSQILPHMSFLSEHLNAVVSKEKTEGKEAAADLFLEKLLHSNEPGWYIWFVRTLKTAQFPFLHKLLNGYHVHNHQIYRNLLTLHLPELLKIHASNLVPQLVAKGCLSEEDSSEILAVEDQKGPYLGAVTLFSRVNCRDDEWFPKLMWVLKTNEHKDIVEEILSKEAAEAESVRTMTHLIKKQMELGGKLFQEKPMDMSDMVTKLHEIHFEDNSGSKGSDVFSGLPLEKRLPPEGQADIANCEKEFVTPVSKGQKRPNSPDNGLELENPKKLNTVLGAPSKCVPGSSNLNNLNNEDKVYMDKFRILVDGSAKKDTNSSTDGTSGLNLSECEEEGVSGQGAESQKLILRAYQEELTKTAMEGKNVVVFASTGSGKSHVAVPEGTPALRLKDAHNPSPKTPTEHAEGHSLEEHGPLNSLANNLNQEEERKLFSTCKSVESENALGDNVTSDTKPKILDPGCVPNEGRPTEGSGATSDSHEFHLNINEPEVEEKQLDLRGYQMELAQPALDGKNIIVSAPTGTGKTHVALKIVQEHFRKADPEQEPKVAFLVPTGELVRQQWKMFKTYLHNHKSVGLRGNLNLLEKVPAERLIHRYEIIILTPQILVDALNDQSVSSLSVFSLLLYDECHHAMKGDPYAKVQYYYLTTKLQNPDQPTNLPQVVGFTASVGVGEKTRMLDGAVKHILKLCANLDVEILKTVEKNRRELDKYENKPNEERKEVKGRVRDPFHDEVSQMMNIIEIKMMRSPELRRVSDQQTAQQLAAPPGERGGERYTAWLGKLKKPIARIRDQDARRFFHACTNHLEFYNCSLVVNADCRTVDALKVIEKKMKKLTPEQEDETDKWLSGMFRDHKDSLKQAGDDPRNSNPKLELVKKMIYTGYQKKTENLRCIMFVKTREMTEALANWINEDGELKHLAASSLAGKGQSMEKAGMNQAKQKDVLQYFKDGVHKVIVATTVAEEGLDIQKCNLVIRYEHVTNEIAYVQARGRGRAEDAEYYFVGGAGSGTVEREEINVMREQLMEKAIKKIREMEEQTFQRYINLYQQEILREWRRKEARRNRRVRSASDDEEDVYELRCIRSDHLACFSSDIRKVKDSHHVVTDVKMLGEVNIEPHPRPGTYDAFTKLGKLFCKKCGEDWGIQVLYKGIKLPVIKISAFVVVFPNGARDSFKKWSQSPFDNDLQTLTDEELNEYNDEIKELDLQ